MAWPDNVTKADLEITCIRGTGKGGQKRNKTSTKVRMKHLPTGIVVECDETRHQSMNRKLAFRKLAEQLIPLMRNEMRKVRYGAGIERIRTYHEPEQRVTDVRIAGQQWRYEDVLNGSALGEIMEALIRSSS